MDKGYPTVIGYKFKYQGEGQVVATLWSDGTCTFSGSTAVHIHENGAYRTTTHHYEIIDPNIRQWDTISLLQPDGTWEVIHQT